MSEIRENVVVDERYRVIDRLGSGGMADVWRAEDLQLGRKVALKVLHSRFAQDREFVERFRREASSAAGLQHPNVVGVFDRGEFDGTYYIAMEYVDGEPLRDVIARGVDIPWALQATRQILAAAEFAHERGIVHRDFKPLNVLIDHDGRARVTDFGIARAGGSEITQTGSVMGTAQYISPEQAQGLEVSPATDVYSIGVILYEMLAGRVPFDGDSAVGVAMRQVSEPPTPPSEINPNVYPALDGVVMRALAKDPRDRYASAREFSAALDQAEANPYGAPADTASYAPLPPAPAPTARRGPWRWILLAILAGGLAALAVWALTRPDAVLVPNVLNKSEERARTLLSKAGFDVRVEAESSARPAGEVFEQDPAAGTEADDGSEVTIVVSRGLGRAAVPDVRDRGVSAAVSALEDEGFLVDQRREFSDEVEEGRVIRTEPGAGVALDRGRTVTIFVSRGADVVSVPEVVGLDRIAAEREIEDAGLIANVEPEDADEPQDQVLRQIPDPGAELDRGDSVTIVVSTGAGSIGVKDVIGQTESVATRKLEKQGLGVRVRMVDVTAPVDDGRVVDQSPGAGSRAVAGETVTIFVGRLIVPPSPGEGDGLETP
jgi:serine/threonine-protein kinase